MKNWGEKGIAIPPHCNHDTSRMTHDMLFPKIVTAMTAPEDTKEN